VSELIPEDVHHVLSRLPKDVRALLISHRLFLAGGFIRSVIAGEPISDVDLFGESKDYLELTAKTFALSRKGSRLHTTDNAFTVLTPGRSPVQFIHRWTYAQSDAARLVAEFDYSVAAAAIWWTGPESFAPEMAGQWHSITDPNYYPDLASRRLRYLTPRRAEDAGGSILRARKFIAKGYHIEAGSLGKVVARLVTGVRGFADFEFPELDPGESKEVGLARILTALMREVDPLTVVDGLELVDTVSGKVVEPTPLEGVAAD
jgi:hypothetical protein